MKEELAAEIEVELTTREDANDAYSNFYAVIKLLELAKSRGQSVEDLKNLVKAMPVVDRQSKIWK